MEKKNLILDFSDTNSWSLSVSCSGCGTSFMPKMILIISIISLLDNDKLTYLLLNFGPPNKRCTLCLQAVCHDVEQQQWQDQALNSTMRFPERG